MISPRFIPTTASNFALVLASALISAFTPSAYADPSGADALMQAVKPSAGGAAETVAMPWNQTREVRLSDPFLMQLFTAWQSEKELAPEVNLWANRIFSGDLEGASHLYTVVESKVNATFQNAFRAGHLYTLWKQELYQTFFDHWLSQLAEPAYAASVVELALEQTIAPQMEEVLDEKVIAFTPEQLQQVKKFDFTRGQAFLSIWAYVGQRGGVESLPVLEKLTISSRFKIPLAQTVSLGFARKGDLAQAARILKTHLEPAIQLKKQPTLLSKHYLQIARLLYQAGSLEGADYYYGKIPNAAPEYLNAREELTWVWLKLNRTDRLRGELTTLTSKYLEGKFFPEVWVVRAISNLKLCYYSAVEKDFQDFMSSNARWAREIDQALVAQPIPAPPRKDEFSTAYERAVGLRTAEAAKLKQLHERSLAAVLPAVGMQKHWEQDHQVMLKSIEEAKKVRDAEFHRQWISLRFAVSESIKKMQFVKVELLSQTQKLAALQQERQEAAQKPGSDQIKVSSASAIRKDTQDAETALKKESEGKMTFPFDGLLWPDELFKLRNLAPGQCLNPGV